MWWICQISHVSAETFTIEWMIPFGINSPCIDSDIDNNNNKNNNNIDVHLPEQFME